uniref:Uncharacterized protein n=1 Tax=Avena sativa TaxID=4498 RepID=A0ACD5TT33_AVESA
MGFSFFVSIISQVNTHALSGGKDSNERNLDEDVLIRYLEFFLEDDDELHKIKKGYKGGAMSSDQVKQHLVTTLAEVLCWHQRARAEVSEEVLDVFMAPRPLPSMFEPSS